MRGSGYHRAVLGRLRRGPQWTPRVDPRAFADLEAFCLFVGYPRSGHSLIGSCLDAHPEMVIAHEADALKMLAKHGWPRERIFEALLENSSAQAARDTGRTQSGYVYAIPGQWQGSYRRLRVIGDKGGGETSRRLAADPSEIRKFAPHVGVPLRVLHITRNPFDSIARIARVTHKGVRKHTLDEAITRFEVFAVANAGFLAGGSEDVMTLRHEDFVANPGSELRSLCAFLGVAPAEEYLEACAGIVWESPHRTRELVEWSDAQIEHVAALIDRYAFFAGYSFEEPATA